MKEDLKNRPTTELFDEVRQQVTFLQVRIAEKEKHLEAAEEKISELVGQIVHRSNFLTDIKADVDEIYQEHNLFKSNEPPFTFDQIISTLDKSCDVPVPVPVLPVQKASKLCFLGENREDFDFDDLIESIVQTFGKNTYGVSSKSVLQSGTMLVLKRLRDVKLPEKEFRERLVMIGTMRHKNVLTPETFYYSNDEKFVIYKFVTTGSLAETLHGTRRVSLSWKVRAKIALTLARGLSFIHSLGPFSAHGNMKSSKVLLANNYESLIYDVGLFLLATPVPSRQVPTCYRVPEVTDPTKASQKADVYSFGVILFELLTGRSLSPQGLGSVEWVKGELQNNRFDELLDEDLTRDPNGADQSSELLWVANNCTDSYPDARPYMHEVIEKIDNVLSPNTFQIELLV